MTYTLPKTVEIGGEEYPIRWDYRPNLDICAALSDPELNDEEKIANALDIFYPELGRIPREHLQEAIERCFWFINCGEDAKSKKSGPRLVDWEQDFPIIVGPVNRVLGLDVRDEKPVHLWTFMSGFQEIGDCTFAQVVRIRSKKAHGKPLDKQDREFYRHNRELIDFKRKYTDADQNRLNRWGGL